MSVNCDLFARPVFSRKTTFKQKCQKNVQKLKLMFFFHSILDYIDMKNRKVANMYIASRNVY